jgi:hypothetical protein
MYGFKKTNKRGENLSYLESSNIWKSIFCNQCQQDFKPSRHLHHLLNSNSNNKTVPGWSVLQQQVQGSRSNQHKVVVVHHTDSNKTTENSMYNHNVKIQCYQIFMQQRWPCDWYLIDKLHPVRRRRRILVLHTRRENNNFSYRQAQNHHPKRYTNRRYIF